MGVLIDQQHLTRENVDMAKKEKPYERNRNTSNCSTKQREKDQPYERKSWLDEPKQHIYVM